MATNSSSSISSTSESSTSINNGGSGNGSSEHSHPTHMSITSHKLNGHNYLPWSQSVMMFICGKGKDDFITGVAESPGVESPTYKQWKTENNMVMSWLINSMTNDIGENFLLYGIANEIWDAARDTYSSSDNMAELFGIESILHDLRQGDCTVTQYYNNLTRHWQQLDMFEKYTWACTKDGTLHREIIEQKRVFKFLLGLNQNLDEVRGRVLGTKPLPKIREVFSEVRREESRKKIMMGTKVKTEIGPSSNEGSAFAIRTPAGQFGDNRLRRGRPWCDHCKKPGHIKEKCWKLHGKPADWKPTHESRGNMVDTDIKLEPSPFSKEQMEVLQKLL